MLRLAVWSGLAGTLSAVGYPILAQTAEPRASFPDVPGWLIGAAISALVTILSGKIVVPTFAYARERERADRLESELKLLRDDLQTEIVPALVRNTDVLAEIANELPRRRER